MRVPAVMERVNGGIKVTLYYRPRKLEKAFVVRLTNIFRRCYASTVFNISA